jgi:hypothetical protein
VFVMQSMPKLHTEEFSRVELWDRKYGAWILGGDPKTKNDCADKDQTTSEPQSLRD